MVKLCDEKTSIFFLQEADELMNLFNQAKESIEDKDEAVRKASEKVVNMKEQAINLIKRLQEKMERIISKFGPFRCVYLSFSSDFFQCK